MARAWRALGATRRTLDARGVGWFLGLAFALPWLLAAPAWLDGRGLHSPWVGLINLMNFAPAVAVAVVTRWISPLPRLRVATGVRWGAPGVPWGRYWLLAVAGPLGFAAAALVLGAASGQLPLDLATFSGFRAARLPGGERVLATGSLPVLAAAWLGATLLLAVVNLPATAGEEWGWRGYLLPRLLPLGQGPALLLSGAVWGLWHAPVVLQGYNYPGHPLLALPLMVLFATVFGTLLGWLRLASGSVGPAVVAHAVLNASANTLFFFGPAGAADAADTAVVGLTGWTGWLAPLLAVAVLVLTHRLPVRRRDEAARRGRAPA
jgi:membrane protease YdiL (CAAX protease family)